MTGLLLLVASCAATCKPSSPPPTFTPAATPEVEPTAAPDYTTPTPAPLTPTPTPAPHTLSLDVNAAGPFPQAAAAPGDYPSTAFYFLRDHSRSVEEMCGSRFATAMKAMPQFVYHYLKKMPALAETEIYLGLGRFPKEAYNPDYPDQNNRQPATVVEQPLTPIADIDDVALQAAVDKTWAAGSINNAQFVKAVEEAVAELEATDAEQKRLVIIGDSILDYDEFNSLGEDVGLDEWRAALTDNDADGTDYLTDLLQDSGVELHYILVDCLPLKSQKTLATSFWTNLAKWHSAVDGFQQDDSHAMQHGKQVKMYGWNLYRPAQAEEVWTEITAAGDSLPPLSRITPIVTGLLDGLLPTSDSDDALWSRQWLWVMPGDAPLDHIELPIPGYASDVDVHLLSFDNRWCAENGGRSECDGLKDDPLLNLYEIPLEAPGANCSGSTLSLRAGAGAPPTLELPTLIWWELAEIPLPDITATVDGHAEVTDQGINVHSRDSLELSFDWARGDSRANHVDFLNNCYRAAVVVGEPSPANGPATAAISAPSGPAWPLALSLGFDPAAGNFENALALQLSRVVNVPDLGVIVTEPLVITHTALSRVAFDFRPTLVATDGQGTCAQQAINGGEVEVCTYEIEVAYTEPGYYDDEDSEVAPAPALYLVADSKESVKHNCAIDPALDDDLTVEETTAAEVLTRHATTLTDGTVKSTLLWESNFTSDRGKYAFSFFKGEVDKCGYRYLLLEWHADEDREDGEDSDVVPVAQIYCSFWGPCVQGARFSVSEE